MTETNKAVKKAVSTEDLKPDVETSIKMKKVPVKKKPAAKISPLKKPELKIELVVGKCIVLLDPPMEDAPKGHVAKITNIQGDDVTIEYNGQTYVVKAIDIK